MVRCHTLLRYARILAEWHLAPSLLKATTILPCPPPVRARAVVHTLSFGEPYPGSRNPLDGVSRMVRDDTGVFLYFAKVIPTVYKGKGDASPLVTNQYSITSQYRPAVVGGMRQNVLPGIFIVYDISPFQVREIRLVVCSAQT